MCCHRLTLDAVLDPPHCWQSVIPPLSKQYSLGVWDGGEDGGEGVEGGGADVPVHYSQGAVGHGQGGAKAGPLSTPGRGVGGVGGTCGN